MVNKNNLGFTLVEILVVIGLITIVASIGLFVSMETYHNSSFHNTRDLLISALQHARALSVNNVCVGVCTLGKAHGIHVVLDVNGNVSKFIVFQGTTYNTSDTTNIPFEIGKNVSAVVRETGSTDVYFNQLSGNASAPSTFILSDNTSESSVVTVGTEGEITWTN